MYDCKTKILSSIPDNTCCSLAFINVVLFSSSHIDTKNSSILINSTPEILDKVKNIISNFYPNIDINIWDDFLLLKGNIYNLLLDCNINETGQSDPSMFSNTCDKLTILKTIFLTNGNFYYNQDNSKNSKGYNFEIVVKDEKFSDFILNLFSEFEFRLKKTRRTNYFVIYTKNSNTICDIFVKFSDVKTALDIQSNLAMREMRNSANRQNNCFESNLDKTIDASASQLNAINYIIDNFSLDILDEKLKEVALVRIANPDVSLNDLKTLLGGKISRAGIKYRLDKIISIYKKLKGAEK